MPLAPLFSQLPFDSDFEDSGFVALEAGPGAFERGDGFVEAGELLFDLSNDATLLLRRRKWKWVWSELFKIYAWTITGI